MKKIGLIAIIVVLSLGIIGVGYAAWSQNFNVTGTASTGSYIVSIQQTPAATMGNDTSGGLIFTASGTLLTTSPSTVTVTDGTSTALVTIGPLTTTGASAGFSVTIAKGYPGLILWVPYKIISSGTVPAKISDVKITNVVTSGLTDPWNGSLTNIKFTTDTTTATADVTVQNTSNGTLGLNLLTNPSLASPVNGILVVSIPDNPGSTQIYAGGQASTQTFNFEIDTVQNP